MTLKELIDITVGENDDPLTDIFLVDFDGNYIYWSKLYILDYYHVRDWTVEQIRVTQNGGMEITLNGGNFEEHHLLNVISPKKGG